MNKSQLCLAMLLPLLLGADAAAQSSSPLHFLAKQCNEDAIRLHLDAAPFRHLVGSQFSLALEDGKATVMILAQNCMQDWMDGELMGPTQEMHVWVAIKGAADIRPVVGAQITRPTMTWFSVFDGNNNARARSARLASGRVQVPINAVTLDPPAPDRGGRISVDDGSSYSWHVSSSSPSARLVGVNHDVYTRDAAGRVVLFRLQVLLNIAAMNSLGALEVTGRTDKVPIIRAGKYPVSVNTYFPVWVRATLGIRADSRKASLLPQPGERR